MNRLSPQRCFSLQNARIPSPWSGPAETGDRITEALAAALTAGMNRNAYLAGRVNYCRDWRAAIELERALMLALSRVAAEDRWRPDKPGRLRNIAGLAILEECDPALRALDKRGVRTDTARSLARQQWMGVSPSAWSRTWAKRYGAARDILLEWKDEADRHIRRHQRA